MQAALPSAVPKALSSDVLFSELPPVAGTAIAIRGLVTEEIERRHAVPRGGESQEGTSRAIKTDQLPSA
jgi:hypothetical protein